LLCFIAIIIKIDLKLFKLLQEPTQKSLTNHKAAKANPKQLKRIPSITMVDMFIFMIALIIITAHIMALIMSCFHELPKEDYVNPYRLPPVRKEHENYIRYERQQYLDSLKNTKRKSKN
jgi:hypothetical protein